MTIASRLKTRWVYGALLCSLVSSIAQASPVDFRKYVTRTIEKDQEKLVNLNESIGTFPMRFNEQGKLEVFVTLRAASDRPIGQILPAGETGYQWDWIGGTPDKDRPAEMAGDMNAVFVRELEEEVGREGAEILQASNTDVPHQAIYNPFLGKYIWMRLKLLGKKQGDLLTESAVAVGKKNMAEKTAPNALRDPAKEVLVARDKKDDTKYAKGVGTSFIVDAQWVPVEILYSLVENSQKMGAEKGCLATAIQSKADWLARNDNGKQFRYEGKQLFGFRKFLGLLSGNPGFMIWADQLRVVMAQTKPQGEQKESPFALFVHSIEAGRPDFRPLSDITPAVDHSIPAQGF